MDLKYFISSIVCFTEFAIAGRLCPHITPPPSPRFSDLPTYLYGFIYMYEKYTAYLKGGLISVFPSSKKVPNHYPSKEKVLRIVIWYIFWRMELLE